MTTNKKSTTLFRRFLKVCTQTVPKTRQCNTQQATHKRQRKNTITRTILDHNVSFKVNQRDVNKHASGIKCSTWNIFRTISTFLLKIVDNLSALLYHIQDVSDSKPYVKQCVLHHWNNRKNRVPRGTFYSYLLYICYFMQYIMYIMRYLYIFYTTRFFFLLVKLSASIFMFHAKHFNILRQKRKKLSTFYWQRRWKSV